MSEPFLSEIKIVSFNFPPKGWALCNGQLLPINQNQALFSLLGTTYGGNGQTTFALPNLRGQVPLHFGGQYTLGESAGQEAHTLTQAEMPAHNHMVNASSAATGGNNSPAGRFLGGGNNVYQTLQNPTTLSPGTIANVGGSQPHNNMMPYLVLNFIIALQGIFPSRN
jgi:microcystin-dependent protein